MTPKPEAEYSPAIQWGALIDGAILKAANLPGDTPCRLAAVGNCEDQCIKSWVFGDPGGYQLPADHFSYTVFAHNEKHGTAFVPWASGDEAPGDWDGGDVLFRGGLITNTFSRWTHLGERWDIIGYQRAAPSIDQGDGDWQPIETAPKNGTAILITRPTDYASEEGWHVVRWEGDDGGWVVHTGKVDYALRGDDPTHWMLLPARPFRGSPAETPLETITRLIAPLSDEVKEEIECKLKELGR